MVGKKRMSMNHLQACDETGNTVAEIIEKAKKCEKRDWRIYATIKREVQELNLSPAEYEKAVKALIEILDL